MLNLEDLHLVPIIVMDMHGVLLKQVEESGLDIPNLESKKFFGRMVVMMKSQKMLQQKFHIQVIILPLQQVMDM